MNHRKFCYAISAAVLVCTLTIPSAFSSEQAKRAVNVDNFKRAESDLYFAKFVADGAFGQFTHVREPTSIDKQDVIRMNRDTLYSFAVIDLGAGPVTVTMPEAGERFMSLQVINQDHYTVNVSYGGGKHTVTPDMVGTRYAMLLVRTFVDPGNENDLQEVNSLQDAMTIDQDESSEFEIPRWDVEQTGRIRKILNDLASANRGIGSSRMFGTEETVDPVYHLMGTAAGWGGNPKEDAYYEGGAPAESSGVYTMTIQDVPVDGFWSVSVYNAQGYFERNDLNRYSINSVTAKKEVDGSVIVQFGGCEDSNPNCIPTTEGWNYVVRLYQPHKEILTGEWTFPKLVPAEAP
ncbi:DUF1254 domain-containing protein [Marinobacter sp. NP-4(2019)]|nr:DUF1254 domain-containing protein [Marinobacter sp. NP-4(2019)]